MFKLLSSPIAIRKLRIAHSVIHPIITHIKRHLGVRPFILPSLPETESPLSNYQKCKPDEWRSDTHRAKWIERFRSGIEQKKQTLPSWVLIFKKAVTKSGLMTSPDELNPERTAHLKSLLYLTPLIEADTFPEQVTHLPAYLDLWDIEKITNPDIKQMSEILQTAYTRFGASELAEDHISPCIRYLSDLNDDAQKQQFFIDILDYILILDQVPPITATLALEQFPPHKDSGQWECFGGVVGRLSTAREELTGDYIHSLQARITTQLIHPYTTREGDPERGREIPLTHEAHVGKRLTYDLFIASPDYVSKSDHHALTPSPNKAKLFSFGATIEQRLLRRIESDIEEVCEVLYALNAQLNNLLAARKDQSQKQIKHLFNHLVRQFEAHPLIHKLSLSDPMKQYRKENNPKLHTHPLYTEGLIPIGTRPFSSLQCNNFFDEDEETGAYTVNFERFKNTICWLLSESYGVRPERHYPFCKTTGKTVRLDDYLEQPINFLNIHAKNPDESRAALHAILACVEQQCYNFSWQSVDIVVQTFGGMNTLLSKLHEVMIQVPGQPPNMIKLIKRIQRILERLYDDSQYTLYQKAKTNPDLISEHDLEGLIKEIAINNGDLDLIGRLAARRPKEGAQPIQVAPHHVIKEHLITAMKRYPEVIAFNPRDYAELFALSIATLQYDVIEWLYNQLEGLLPPLSLAQVTHIIYYGDSKILTGAFEKELIPEHSPEEVATLIQNGLEKDRAKHVKVYLDHRIQSQLYCMEILKHLNTKSFRQGVVLLFEYIDYDTLIQDSEKFEDYETLNRAIEYAWTYQIKTFTSVVAQHDLESLLPHITKTTHEERGKRKVLTEQYSALDSVKANDILRQLKEQVPSLTAQQAFKVIATVGVDHPVDVAELVLLYRENKTELIHLLTDLRDKLKFFQTERLLCLGVRTNTPKWIVLAVELGANYAKVYRTSSKTTQYLALEMAIIKKDISTLGQLINLSICNRVLPDEHVEIERTDQHIKKVTHALFHLLAESPELGEKLLGLLIRCNIRFQPVRNIWLPGSNEKQLITPLEASLIFNCDELFEFILNSKSYFRKDRKHQDISILIALDNGLLNKARKLAAHPLYRETCGLKHIKMSDYCKSLIEKAGPKLSKLFRQLVSKTASK